MSSHSFATAGEAFEAGYPFRCCCGIDHSSVIRAAHCPECVRNEDHDRYVYRRVVHVLTGEVLWRSAALVAAEVEEAAYEAAEREAEREAVSAQPLTHSPFRGAF